MKRTITIIMAMFGIVAYSIGGDISEKIITVNFTTNTTALVTSSDVTMNGFIEQITLDVPAVTTMTNAITVVAVDKTGASTTLATGSLNADKVYRPMIYQTNTDGAETNTTTKFLLLGETLRLSVTNASGGTVSMSNATFRAIIKTSK
jgi:hypothetical protein